MTTEWPPMEHKLGTINGLVFWAFEVAPSGIPNAIVYAVRLVQMLELRHTTLQRAGVTLENIVELIKRQEATLHNNIPRVDPSQFVFRIYTLNNTDRGRIRFGFIPKRSMAKFTERQIWKYNLVINDPEYARAQALHELSTSGSKGKWG